MTGKPVVVYPNSGEDWDAVARSWRGSGPQLPGEVAGWVADGARLVGGCCRVDPGGDRGAGRRAPDRLASIANSKESVIYFTDYATHS